MTNTVLDSTVNLFLLENDGVGPDQSKYPGRQKNRIENDLKEYNKRFDPNQGISRDSALRCACFVEWGLFHKRISIEELSNIQGIMETANKVEEFAATAPPR